MRHGWRPVTQPADPHRRRARWGLRVASALAGLILIAGCGGGSKSPGREAAKPFHGAWELEPMTQIAYISQTFGLSREHALLEVHKLLSSTLQVDEHTVTLGCGAVPGDLYTVGGSYDVVATRDEQVTLQIVKPMEGTRKGMKLDFVFVREGILAVDIDHPSVPFGRLLLRRKS